MFTDVCLGDLNGIDAAHLIRSAQPGLPVLVTSGLDPAEVTARLREGIHFLPKPYSMSELLDAIRSCFGAMETGRAA
ncbi:hypothetical protein D9M72_650340 [compost metagenome]